MPPPKKSIKEIAALVQQRKEKEQMDEAERVRKQNIRENAERQKKHKTLAQYESFWREQSFERLKDEFQRLNGSVVHIPELAFGRKKIDRDVKAVRYKKEKLDILHEIHMQHPDRY